MKLLLNLFLIVILFTGFAFGQTFDVPGYSRGDAELVIDFGMASTALDSAATDTTTHFSLADYDGSGDDIFTLFVDLASGGTPKTTVSIQASEDLTTWATIESILSSSTVTTPTWTVFDIADKRAAYYRLILDNEDTGAALTGYHVKVRACLKDPRVTN